MLFTIEQFVASVLQFQRLTGYLPAEHKGGGFEGVANPRAHFVAHNRSGETLLFLSRPKNRAPEERGINECGVL